MTERLVVAAAVRTAAGSPGDTLHLRDGVVVAAGRSEDLRRLALPEERYPGAVIVPGLRDAHFHPVTYAAALTGTSVKAAADFADLGARLHEAAGGMPAGAALSAFRLDDESLAEGRLPDRTDLDRVGPGRPVLLHRYCGHIGAANTAALDLAGVAADTPDPPGGAFDRDDAGRPTGVLRETAVGIVSRALARAAPAPLTDAALLGALTGLAGLGITSIGAILACADEAWADVGDQVARIAALAADLPIRVHALVVADTPAELERQAEVVGRSGGDRFRFLGLKAFADGSLGGHTAAMYAPFADRPDATGLLRLDHDWAVAMGRSAVAMGGRVALHAIGDRANGAVLDVFDELGEGGADPAVLRVEHASVLDPTLIDRFAALGVTASVQPAFLMSETTWLEKRLGAARLRSTYPLASLEAAGVPLAGGSDCPVEPPHPLWGMAAARDRGGLVPAEALASESALALFTDGAAAALGEPTPLAPGSPADFVVLDRDPVAATPDELRSAHVIDTWIDGHPIDVDRDREVWSG